MIDRTMKEFLKRSIKKDEKDTEPVIKENLKKYKAVEKETADKATKVKEKVKEL